jgi:hypothetical protein
MGLSGFEAEYSREPDAIRNFKLEIPAKTFREGENGKGSLPGAMG